MRLHRLSSNLPGAVFAAIDALAAALNSLTGCILTRVSVTYRDDDSGLDGVPGPAGNTGLFVFETATAGQLAELSLPDVRAAFVPLPPTGDGVSIDLAAPAVAAFVQSIIDGGWTNPFGHDITAIDVAYVIEDE